MSDQYAIGRILEHLSFSLSPWPREPQQGTVAHAPDYGLGPTLRGLDQEFRSAPLPSPAASPCCWASSASTAWSATISERRREIGIRLALGARHGQVRRMFVTLALVLVGIGVAIGLAASAGLTRLMKSQLFGVSALDPLTHAAVALALFAAAGLASYVSARQASTLDPVEVLRGD